MDDIPTIDLRGLQCPSPLVKLNEEITAIANGDEVIAVADDPAFRLDVEAWCEYTGNELVVLDSAESTIHARIRRLQP